MMARHRRRHHHSEGSTIDAMPNHVIVSTLGWSKASLEEALAGIAALEFGQADLALHEGWAHLSPAELAAGGPARVQQEAARVRDAVERLSMKRVSACNVGLGQADAAEQRRRLEAVCDLAQALEVPVITIPAAPRGAPLEAEAARLRDLLPVALGRGVQLTVETHVGRLTEVPEVAVRLCREAEGVGLTLDPSHFHAGPNQGADFSAVFPYVRHVHLRDAGRRWEEIQVAAGSGEVDFDALVRGLHGAGYEGKFAIEYIDSIPIVAPAGAPGGEPLDVPANVLRMRDIFVAAERGAGIVRG
jgi:sugar phosphate isomerase/epimerase